jgi:multimeric flavodoxin WrbA
LILSSSPRKGGNSDLLCDEFANGATEAGHQVEKIFLADKEIIYCTGCDICQNNDGSCIHKDDMSEILQRMISSDVIVFAVPIYCGSMYSKLKVFMERTYPQYTKIKNEDVYLLVTGVSNTKHRLDNSIVGLRNFVAGLPNSKEKGIVYGINTYKAGSVKETPAMKETYEMGGKV